MILIAPIQTEEDHQKALREAESLFDAQPGTPQFARLNALVEAIQRYERRVFTLPEPSLEAVAEYEETKRANNLVAA